MSHAQIGQLAGFIALIQIIPYIVSILRGHTKPERMSYLLWFIVDVLGIASYISVGARTTIWTGLIFCFTGGLVLLLSIKHGIGGFSHFDILCFLLALLGGVLWYTSGNALIGLYITTFVGFIGYLPTIKKVYFLPQTENTLSWAGAATASCLNLFALTTFTASIVLPVVCAALLQSLVVALLVFPRLRFAYPVHRPHKVHMFLHHPVFAR